jgi:tetratricopeptide (TPR) repeat protein/O-antigen ligase
MMTPTHVRPRIFTPDPLFFYGVLIVIFLCPFVYIRGLFNYVILPQSAFIQVLSVLLLILLLFLQVILKTKIKIPWHSLNIAMVLFAAWTLVSCFYAHNRYEAFDQWFQWLACLVFFCIFQAVITSENRAVKVLGTLYAAGLLTAIIGVGQYIFSMDIIPQSVPPSATFANKNMAAQFITLTLPLGWMMLWGSKKWETTWFSAISAGIMIVFLIYTRTRAAWVAVSFEIILMTAVFCERYFRNKIPFFWNKDKTVASLTAVFIILLFANMGPQGFKWQFGSIADQIFSISGHGLQAPTHSSEAGAKVKSREPGISQESSAGLRLAIWKNTLEMIKEKPFMGYGLGNHKVYYPLFHDRIMKEKAFSETQQLTNVHNDFLQLFAETGIIGIVAASGVLFSFFSIIVRIYRTRTDMTFFAAMGIGIAIAGILVNSCFSFPFEMPIPPLILMIYFAIALGCLQNKKTGTLKIPRQWLIVIIVFLLPLLAYSVRYYYLDIKCDGYFLQAKTFEKKRDWNAVIVSANKAYALNPNRKKILSYAARGYIESKEPQKGIDALEKVIQSYPYHMNALLNIGVAYTGLKQYDTAMGFYEKALDIKSDFSKAHINMGGIYMTWKKYDKAVDSFQKARVNDPDNPMILYNMGMSLLYLKKYDKAAQALEQTIKIRPAWPRAQLNLAILYYQYLDKKAQSVPYFKRALEQDPHVRNKHEIQKIIKNFVNSN